MMCHLKKHVRHEVLGEEDQESKYSDEQTWTSLAGHSINFTIICLGLWKQAEFF
jgi:hypothetical protein